MSDTPMQDFIAQQSAAARVWKPRRQRGPRHRRLKRIIVAVATSLVVLIGGIAGAGYLFVNHLLSGIHRIPNIAALDAAHQPVMPATTRRSMTTLLVGSAVLPAVRHGGGPLGSSQAPEDMTGLIALVHLNASKHGGAVVSIPPDAVVQVPGFGQLELWQTLKFGGPSLLIRTVEKLTNVRIDHYSVLDFAGVDNVIGAMNGVNVDVPYTVSSDGYSFPAGVDHLNSADVLPYVRQPAVSEIGRELLEQNLIRAMLDKIASQHLITTDYRVVRALDGALSVDSNFSNSQLGSLALRLQDLRGRDGVFVTAPTINGSPVSGGTGPVYLNERISAKLWQAIRHDAVAAFARRYPFTVTPGDPG